MRIALKHELQHHRAGDTRWLYVLEFLKALFFWNPWVYALSSTLSQIQEFACDEFLIGHRKISTHAYGHCLLQVAQSAIQPRRIWAGTARMSGKMESSHLKRRVEMLFRYRSSGSSRALVLIALGTFSLMASLAYASRSAIQDRAITLAEAKTYAQVASSIPLNVNELVVEKLNRFVGTPEGRTFLRNAFDRLPQYQSMIEKKARAYGLPEELVAIAMFESGLQNDAVSPAPYRAAGLWQFVPETARRYGLTVNATQDERLQSEKETDAAMSYLRDLYNIFQDWRLALKAYNEGESRVLQLIEQYKTRDAWELERASTRESYLSGATAMLIIYKNPSLMK
jgi:soluble lytic murein transglycosylase-like protein